MYKGGRMRWFRAPMVPVLLLLAPAALAAQGATVRGRVADKAGAPLAHADVTIDGTLLRASTTALGEYTITGVPSGTRTVRARLLGYVQASAQVTVAGGQSVEQNFALTAQAIGLAPIDVVEVLRDGASAQYGSDAIAGVVNVVLKEGNFTPFLNATTGRYTPRNYPDDGTTVDVNGGWGTKLGRGTLALFGEFMDRQPTNRAWADIYENAGTGEADSVNSIGQVVIKRNPVPQPNHHWGEGLEKDVLSMGNLRLPLNDAGTQELYAFGGYSFRHGTGNGYRRCPSANCAGLGGRNWPEIYPLGYLPGVAPDVHDHSRAGGVPARTQCLSGGLLAAFGAPPRRVPP